MKQRPETPKMVKKDTKMGKTVTHKTRDISNHPYESLCDYQVPETMLLQL